VLFLKPTSSFLHATAAPPAAIEVPEPLESLHHEVELAVVISRRGRDVPEASAMDFVGGNLRCASAMQQSGLGQSLLDSLCDRKLDVFISPWEISAIARRGRHIDLIEYSTRIRLLPRNQ
jgi:hypothetical protein